MSLTPPRKRPAPPDSLCVSNQPSLSSSSRISPPSPQVSILLSVHNGSSTLDLALASVYRQTFQNFIVVAVNDGSQDNTSELLRSWRQKFGVNRFRIINNPKNLGLTASLNIGIKVCSTPYVARLDADDSWLPDKLALQIDFLQRHPDYGVVGCWYANIHHQTQRIFRLPVTDSSIKRNIFRINPFGHSCIVIRRKLLETVDGYAPTAVYSQDRELWFRLLPLTSFYNLPFTLCHRQVTGSISQTKYQRQMWQSIKIRWHYSRLYHASLINYLFLILPFFIWLQPSFIKKLNLASHFYTHFAAPAHRLSSDKKLQLCVLNDRPLLPHRGETIARRAMATAFASHPLLQHVSVINIIPYRAFFLKLPQPQLLYLRCGASAAASVCLRHWYSSHLILLEVHNLSLPQLSLPAVLLYRLAAKRCDLLITIDPITTQTWLALGAKQKNIIELPSGSTRSSPLTTTAKNEIRKKYHLPINQSLIVYSGNLYRVREIKVIIQAAHQLQHQPLHFAIAGGTPEDIRFYRRFLQSHWPSQHNVSLLGLLPHHDVMPLLSAADLILVTYSKHCPTINTMSPLKFYEALSSGTPVLAADFARLRLSSSPRQITFYEPDNLTDFIQKISQALSSSAASPSSPSAFLTWSARVDRILNHVLL